MSLSDSQLTQIRERLKELANHAREHAFCDGYRDIRPVSMRRLDDEKFFRDLLALVDQLRQETLAWRLWMRTIGFKFEDGRENDEQLRGLLYQTIKRPRACACSEPDPVMQVDMCFYCHKCSFQTGARPSCLPEMEAVRASEACARLRTALEAVDRCEREGCAPCDECRRQIAAALRLPQETTREEEKTEGSQR